MVYFQVLWTFGNMTVLCFNSSACQNQSKSRQTAWKVTEETKSLFTAVPNNSLNCPGSAFVSLRVLSQMFLFPSLCINAHFCQTAFGLISPFLLWSRELELNVYAINKGKKHLGTITLHYITLKRSMLILAPTAQHIYNSNFTLFTMYINDNLGNLVWQWFRGQQFLA